MSVFAGRRPPGATLFTTQFVPCTKGGLPPSRRNTRDGLGIHKPPARVASSSSAAAPAPAPPPAPPVEDTCMICLAPFTQRSVNQGGLGPMVQCRRPCAAKFHNDCIETWIDTKDQCPLCQIAPFDDPTPRNGNTPPILRFVKGVRYVSATDPGRILTIQGRRNGSSQVYVNQWHERTGRFVLRNQPMDIRPAFPRRNAESVRIYGHHYYATDLHDLERFPGSYPETLEFHVMNDGELFRFFRTHAQNDPTWADSCFNRISYIRFDASPNVTDAGLREIVRRCPRLRRLDIPLSFQGSLSVRRTPPITEAGLMDVVRGLPELRVVTADIRTLSVTDAWLRELALRCPRLIKLKLPAGMRHITDAGFAALAQGCTYLRLLRIGGASVTDAGVDALARGCPKLTSVTLTHCNNLTDVSLQALSRECKRLGAVNFRGISTITDTGLVALARPVLQRLELYSPGANVVTDRTLVALGSRCPNLTLLRLIGQNRITDAGIHYVASYCPRLTNVDIHSCRLVTDQSVSELAQRCPRLSKLDVSDCVELTDVGVAAVAQHCHQLTYLDMSGCNKITAKGIKALAAGCPSLKTVFLCFLPHIPTLVTGAVRDSHPGVTIHRYR